MSSKRTTKTRKSKKGDTPNDQGVLSFQSAAQARKSVKRDINDPMNTYPVGGINVEFPFKPYPAQIQMMSKIVTALKNKQNALLESPTGSGKSLAILCASLAWATYEKNRLTEEAETIRAQKIQAKERIASEAAQNIASVIVIDAEEESEEKEAAQLNVTQKRPINENGYDDDDFRPTQLPRKLARTIGERSKSRSPAPEVDIDQGNGVEQQQKNPNEPPALVRAPKIYVGSRTHKQLSQLVAELKRNTRYRPKMSVLGSRDHYCLHHKVKKVADKSEACSQQLDAKSCIYSQNVSKILMSKDIRPGGDKEVWDIEDLTQVAKKTKGCPYFAARTLSEQAEIIFCPYNYLLDPIIRSSMDLDLTGSVVVLDEAHNIEDVARSSASFEITELDLKTITMEMNQVLAHPRTEQPGNINLKHSYTSLLFFTESMVQWMTQDQKVPPTVQKDSYEAHNKVWNDKDLIAAMKEFNASKETLKAIMAAFEFISKDIAKLKQGDKRQDENSDASENERPDLDPNMNSMASQIIRPIESSPLEYNNPRRRTRESITTKSFRSLEALIMVLKFIFPEGEPSREKDYSLVLIERVERKLKKSDWEVKLAFWCQNPGIVFRDMAKTVHSVILTSGTLSPLDTFASELETPFPIRLEANHVIDKSQVWIRSFMQGPKSVQLHGTWERASQFLYQDDVGDSLYQISEIIPYGVLCFVPSYNAMEKLLYRWQTTGLYDRLQKKKHIICETSGKGTKELFKQLMNRFYNHISEAEQAKGQDSSGKNGAILFAVYRGKVSEGIDFTDNNCRAVVALGIPFPNIRDIQVDLKRDYNSKRYKSGEPVLDGGAWYQTQAYRAINQALGRCLRHRLDWGAIILLESRFCEEPNVQQLSKWVQPLCRIESNHAVAMDGLRKFVSERHEHERLERERLKQEKLDIKIEPVSPPTTSNSTDSPTNS